MRVLMALWDVGGQVPVEIGVARRLINAGHQVTVVGEPTTQPAATTVGARFTPWVTAPTAVEDDIADWECRTPLTLFPRGLVILLGYRWRSLAWVLFPASIAMGVLLWLYTRHVARLARGATGANHSYLTGIFAGLLVLVCTFWTQLRRRPRETTC